MPVFLIIPGTYLSACTVDDGLTQTKSQSWRLILQVGILVREQCEDILLQLLGQSYAGILHLNIKATLLHIVVQGDLALFGIFQRIVQQVHDHHAQQFRID